MITNVICYKYVMCCYITTGAAATSIPCSERRAGEKRTRGYLIPPPIVM